MNSNMLSDSVAIRVDWLVISGTVIALAAAAAHTANAQPTAILITGAFLLGWAQLTSP